MTPRRRLWTTLFMTLFLVLTGCDAGTNSLVNVPEQDEVEEETISDVVAEDAFDEDFQGTLEVTDQVSDGESVTIDGAAFEVGSGWVAVFLDQEGAPGKAIGWARLDQGSGGSVEVELQQTLGSDTTLWAQLHTDAEPLDEFNWPGEDLPITGPNGEVVQDRFMVEVEEDLDE